MANSLFKLESPNGKVFVTAPDFDTAWTLGIQRLDMEDAGRVTLELISSPTALVEYRPEKPAAEAA